MIVDDLRVEPSGDRAELSGRLRLESAAEAPDRVWFRYPADMGDPEPDGSPFVPGLLLTAMYLGEDLHVDGPVSARLLEGAAEARTLYRSWWPAFAESAVSGEARRLDGNPGHRATLFTRGVDSTYAALTEPVDTLLYSAAVDFVWGKLDSGPEETMRARAPVVEAHRESAERLGRRLVVVDTNLRHFVEPLRGWGDTHGGILAACGLAVGAQVAELGIPSSYALGNLLPLGSHPLLDRHWSTERTTVAHGAPEVPRTEKLVALAADPHGLDELLVCSGPGPRVNCCRCDMCVFAMVHLEAVGALDRARTFPGPLRVRDVARLRTPNRLSRMATRLRIEDVLTHGGRLSLAAALEVGLARYHLERFARLSSRIARVAARRAHARAQGILAWTSNGSQDRRT